MHHFFEYAKTHYCCTCFFCLGLSLTRKTCTTGGSVNEEPNSAGNPLTYSSPLIQERRRRILKEIRKLISEKGLTNFSVRELCKQADIAQRTLYNHFSSKERAAALAIKEAFDEIRYHVHFQTSATTIEGMIDRAITINSRNLRVKNYALAVATIYFSPSSTDDVWEVLQKMGTSGITVLLESLAEDGQLEDWVDIEEVALTFSNASFAIINEWCLGRLSDEDYLRRVVDALLLLLCGVCRSRARETAMRYLSEIHQSGKLPTFPKPSYRVKATSDD